MVSVELSFDASSNGAWDDRELVNAYDAAMDEFHAHHPGPGSWLDKMTAAQAAGEPLPGTSAHGTAWYTATVEVDDPETLGQTVEPTPRHRKRTRRDLSRDQPAQESGAAGARQNPYAAATLVNNIGAQDRARSPQYIPTSPTYAVPANNLSLLPVDQEDISHITAVQRHTSTPVPNVTLNPTASVSVEDALSYAMTSQYMAGYWMGVSQALQDTRNRSQADVVARAPRHTSESELAASNETAKQDRGFQR